jgi:Zn-dependent protease with chaperone function
MSMPSDGLAAYQGRFSDGLTAAVAPATVRLTPQGVAIAPDGRAELTWPYAELAAASPVRSGTGEILLRHAPGQDATLFVSNSEFVAALVARAPQLTSRARRWRIARPLLAACAALLLLVAGLWFMDVSPARGVARLLPDEVRKSLGRQVVVSMGQGRGTCQARDGRAALDRLIARLSPGTRGTRFSVTVLDWGLVNAFAAPGEQIVLTRGLLEQAKSPDEVAGVLAHEMGHGLELHPEAGIIRAIGIGAAAEIVLGGSSSTLANIGVLLAQLGYTRAAEREADAHGLRILEQAKVSPRGIADFFRRIDERDKDSPIGNMSFLSTHPQSAERARLAESRASYLTTPALSEADWQALRSICGTPK